MTENGNDLSLIHYSGNIMKIKTKPLLITIAVSFAISNQAIATYTPTVSAGTTVDGETIQGVDALQQMYGTANNTTILSGTQNVYGVANDTVVYGVMNNDGGVDNGTVIKSGGVLSLNGDVVNNQQAISNNALAEDGATVFINDNAQANGLVINGKHTTVLLNTETSVINDSTVNNGGLWVVKGTATNTILNDSTMLNSAGVDIDTVVNSGSLYNLDGSATSSNLTVNSGGAADIFGGIANNTTIYGLMTNSGGIDNGTVIKSGGTLSLSGDVANNKMAISNNAVAEDGTTVLINDNAQANGLIINGLHTTALLNTDTSVINDSTVNNSFLWVVKGTATGTILNDSTMINDGGADINTVVNSGSLYNLDGGATSSNLTVNSGGTAEIYAATLSDATVNGNMIAYNSTNIPSTIQGEISVNDGGKLTLVSGVNAENADVTLSGSGGLYIAGNASANQNYHFSLGAMRMNGGSVYFDETGNGASQSGYSYLTLDSLDGAGSFYMNTDLASLQGDFLTVKGKANGDFNVYIADTGVNPTSDSSLHIIQTGGGNADFTLTNNGHVVDVGTYQYYLVADGEGGWALSSQAAPEPTPDLTPSQPQVASTITPSTAAVLSMATVDPLIFQAELGSVRSHLEQVRSFSHDTNVWAHYTTNSYNVGDAAGADYGMHLNGVTIGADKSKESANGVTTQGLFFSYSHSSVDFDRGGDGNVDSYSAGAYASYIHNSGFYLDGVMKINSFGHDVNGRMTGGEAANGHYNTTGIGASLQGGKYFYFGDSYIAPYASVTGFTSNTRDYTLSNGMKAHVDPLRSVIGETGINLGHKFIVQGAQVQPYLKLAVTQEFINGNAVNVNDDHFNNDLSGTRGVYQLGINAKVTDRITINVDASYAQGSHVEAPWTANLGASWSF